MDISGKTELEEKTVDEYYSILVAFQKIKAAEKKQYEKWQTKQ